MDSDPDFVISFKIALDALVRVTKGSSERDAVAASIPTSRRSPGLVEKTLGIVLSTVDEQDLLDGVIGRVFPDHRFPTGTQCLLRLVAHVISRPDGRTVVKRLEHSLRNTLAPELIPSVELMLGTHTIKEELIVASGPSDVDRVSIKTHNPSWWVRYCFKLLGRKEAIELLSGNPRVRYVRVNSLRNRGRTSLPKSNGDWESALEKIPVESHIYLLKAAPSSLSKYFSQGLFQFQDLASFLAVKAADPKPGEKVLDLCAAPGTKTSAAAQLMRNRGRIVSVDYSHRRMNAWRRETRRLGVTIAEPVIADATRICVNEKFDLAIVDPPCTGTGVLDRNPSMKWRLSEKSLQRLTNLQWRMLESAASLVGLKGRILYCTCSLTMEENELIIARFLRNHPEFETTPSLVDLGSTGLRGFSDCRRFYPYRDKTAGYFIARMDQPN